MTDKRITVRFNEREDAELNLLKKTFHIDNDSEAIKMAVEWVNGFLKNVTQMFFPPTHDVVLVKKTKAGGVSRKIYG